MKKSFYIAILGSDGKEYVFVKRFKISTDYNGQTGVVGLNKYAYDFKSKWYFSTTPHRDNIFTYPTKEKAQETIDKAIKRVKSLTIDDFKKKYNWSISYHRNNSLSPQMVNNVSKEINVLLTKLVIKEVEQPNYIFGNTGRTGKKEIEVIKNKRREVCSKCGLVLHNIPHINLGTGRFCVFCFETISSLMKPEIEKITEDERKEYHRCKLVLNMQ